VPIHILRSLTSHIPSLRILIRHFPSTVYVTCDGLRGELHIIFLVPCKQSEALLTARTPEAVNLNAAMRMAPESNCHSDLAFLGFDRFDLIAYGGEIRDVFELPQGSEQLQHSRNANTISK
jgi:hypothetical protein